MKKLRLLPVPLEAVARTAGTVISTDRCTRCNGNIVYQHDKFGFWIRCIQCGREVA